ncbi:conserved hypothetical protein [Sporisorium reilianum SRZ2]|uniref:Uncharacterized protein n=1 Tax=Sporisorium reilianum (strain SRZ2) TaxID=999809 RepID=E6ZSC4_SPORE|nr:conserved hypothetical protein [Sporisorium reilianum SRZ2]
MRRSNSTLPARDACRAWLQPMQPPPQRRVHSSAALHPGYVWAASSSASSSSSSSSSPFSFLYSAVAGPSTKSARSSRPLFALAYSTSNPPYPLPGSNNDIDPRGVDYSLFEPEDEAYTQHASTSTTATQQDAAPSTSAVDSTALSAPTQLLVRLINAHDYEAATTVLHELLALRSPLDEPLPHFAGAALWAIRNGKPHDMLAWMHLCPGYTAGTRFLNTASSATYAQQARSIATNFRKCFMVLLDSHGDDLRLLQQASMVAADKGMWGVLQSALAQILRFGVGGNGDDAGWEYFERLVLATQRQRDRGAAAAKRELRGLYNLGIRTLALAGRLDDAVRWAGKCTQISSAHSPFAQIVVLEPFTETLLIEELVKAGASHTAQARSLAAELATAATRSPSHRPTDVDAVLARIEREAAFRADDADYAHRAVSELDRALQECLEQGDVIAAREYLLSVLRSAARVRRDEDDIPPSYDASSPSDEAVFAHLPSARILSELQRTAHRLGTIAVTSALTETHMQHVAEPLTETHESLTAEEFLRPVRAHLLSVRGGKGLWETARLYGLVQRARWREAVQFYVGSAGFKVPSGGVSRELAALALGSAASEAGRREELDGAQRARGKHWPSTHAINLVLKALVGVCVDAKDYARLERVYVMWKHASHPTTSEEEGLHFEQWPPAQRPSSHTFDAFLRAFGRLDIDAHSTAGDTAAKEKQAWGSSGALMGVVRDMTDTFGVRPSISTWTIALECLAREGRARWSSTTSVLARAVGIRTNSSSVVEEEAHFPPANLATYTALMRALIRVPHTDGGSMMAEARGVRDDLLLRTVDLDVAVRGLVLAEREEGAEEFWSGLLQKWQEVQQDARGGDARQRWDAREVLRANGGRTIEVLREVWMLESDAEGEVEG